MLLLLRLEGIIELAGILPGRCDVVVVVRRRRIIASEERFARPHDHPAIGHRRSIAVGSRGILLLLVQGVARRSAGRGDVANEDGSVVFQEVISDENVDGEGGEGDCGVCRARFGGGAERGEEEESGDGRSQVVRGYDGLREREERLGNIN